jgi:hypothetical protein
LPQALPRGWSLIALDGVGKPLIEAVQRAEQAGIDEPKQVPQFAQVVLDRGAGGDDFEVALQGHGRLRSLRVLIFDGLGFVQHNVLPLDLGEHFGFIFLLQQTVAAHHQIAWCQGVEHLLAIAAAKLDDR